MFRCFAVRLFLSPTSHASLGFHHTAKSTMAHDLIFHSEDCPFKLTVSRRLPAQDNVHGYPFLVIFSGTVGLVGWKIASQSSSHKDTENADDTGHAQQTVFMPKWLSEPKFFFLSC
ncbi:hypothetical protein QBC46DRAFT_382275 [Diplogelasinospora grovesii]|uniref:Uncharacterized protein n=1 Tax=Diplogelasinospora grovesii TaxID=303347 RepID=A0AAN6N9I1_9PEZI|nr:hypothetical protein QBC46DRAFT_382275 [Diplogelasinospora grovesii]